MNIDWKWVGLGTLIMLVLGIAAGVIFGVIAASALEGVTDPADVSLSGGQMALAGLLNVLAFAVGGYIVGLKSAGRTIWEPAIAAAVAVAFVLLLSGNFGLGNVIGAGLVPFLAALGGGWLGEKRQDSKSSP
ncbi:MAG: hypothetical protein OES78_00720 [Chromatiales bacterium]|jgi:hypothetical protein|nr:hypothetical protein [Chromatiales bacterium]MDH3931763.1 hypothetical protein [Chromatiales bacterium]MDH3945987.1 hypothetical protein [Chromatiales bacterium]MDH4014414.1 hypothetical protein [Chromatiales bacterium]PLX55944.1 MAG: hypothetical protein C0629_09980 [Chromatiales bacterium]